MFKPTMARVSLPKDLALEATCERMVPGTGEFDLAALLPLVPSTARLAVEAPFRALVGMTSIERARIVVEATRTHLANR